MVVEISKEHYGSVPKVTGLQMDYIVLNQKLPVVDDVIFQELLQMTQYFSSTMITFGDMESDMISLVDGIHFDSHENVSCTIGDIESVSDPVSRWRASFRRCTIFFRSYMCEKARCIWKTTTRR